MDWHTIHKPDADCNFSFESADCRPPKYTKPRIASLFYSRGGLYGFALTVHDDARVFPGGLSVYCDDHGWHGMDSCGQQFDLFVDHLTDSELAELSEVYGHEVIPYDQIPS